MTNFKRKFDLAKNKYRVKIWKGKKLLNFFKYLMNGKKCKKENHNVVKYFNAL